MSTTTASPAATQRAAATGVRFRATARSEWIKFRSVRSGPAVLAATALILLFGSWLVSASYHSGWATMSVGDRATFDPTYQSIRGIEVAQLFVAALGVMTVTGEYSSGLIRATFTATPQRVQVIAIQAAILGAVLWASSTVLSFAAFFIGQGVLTSPVPHASLGDPGVLRAVFGGGLYLMLVALFGLFIGVLIRRTAAALAVVFGLLLVLPVIAAMLPSGVGDHVAKFLPSSAGSQVWHVVHDPRELGALAGFGVFVLYVAATAVAALVLVRRRDV
jgi:ABC-2 type transport system permease protein